MAKGRERKSDIEFFRDTLDFFYDNGQALKEICPECTDEYNDHSLLKLLCINYWVGIFSPISHRQLREKFGYKVAYVDSMAGSGVTTTKRAGDYLCGSCPGAVLSAANRGFPFDLVIFNEIDSRKADVLTKRLKKISSAKIVPFKEDILKVSNEIAKILNNQTVSYVVIDPHALQGMTWSALKPLLSCKGDAMITWFEREAWRLKCAASSSAHNPKSEGQKKKLTDLFGDEQWIETGSAEELTSLFIENVIRKCGKKVCGKVKIPRTGKEGNYYLMLLFAGDFRNAEKLVNDWKYRVETRIQSIRGADMSSLLDIKAGRATSLDQWP